MFTEFRGHASQPEIDWVDATMAGSSTTEVDAGVIDYISPQPAPPRELTLEETNGCVRVVFAVPPNWVYVLQFAFPLTVGLLEIAIIMLLLRFAYRTGPPALRNTAVAGQLKMDALFHGGMALFWWAIAAYKWCMYRRWGRVSRVLAATNEGVVLSRLGWWRMRERNWPVSEITSVGFRPLKFNLNWKQTAGSLHIRCRKGRRLVIFLSSRDAQVPARVAQQFAVVLGRPLATD